MAEKPGNAKHAEVAREVKDHSVRHRLGESSGEHDKDVLQVQGRPQERPEAIVGVCEDIECKLAEEENVGTEVEVRKCVGDVGACSTLICCKCTSEAPALSALRMGSVVPAGPSAGDEAFDAPVMATALVAANRASRAIKFSFSLSTSVLSLWFLPAN